MAIDKGNTVAMNNYANMLSEGDVIPVANFIFWVLYFLLLYFSFSDGKLYIQQGICLYMLHNGMPVIKLIVFIEERGNAKSHVSQNNVYIEILQTNYTLNIFSMLYKVLQKTITLGTLWILSYYMSSPKPS